MFSLAATRFELRLAVNGYPIHGLLHASIFSSNCFSSDSYIVTLAMGLFPLGDIAFWSELTAAYIKLTVTIQGDQISQDLISGMIDTVIVDPIQGTVIIEGRDLSSTLIDAYRQQDFVNQTASEVVSTIASQHGLRSAVTTTYGSVGRYYGDGYTRLSLGQFSRIRSDWDLVVQLARENSFDVFVNGQTLFFQPSAALGDMPIRISTQRVKTMRLERTLAIASDAEARVQSWNSQNVRSYDSGGTDGANIATQASSSLANQPFLFSGPNYTSQQVTDCADRYTIELSRLGLMLHIEMPWDLALSPRTVILLDDTNSSFDTTYKIDTIERHYSATSGSSQVIRAARHSNLDAIP